MGFTAEAFEKQGRFDRRARKDLGSRMGGGREWAAIAHRSRYEEGKEL